MLKGNTHPKSKRSQTAKFITNTFEIVCNFFSFLMAKITIIFPEIIKLRLYDIALKEFWMSKSSKCFVLISHATRFWNNAKHNQTGGVEILDIKKDTGN